MALLARANELQAAGHDVIHLEIGEPDFTTAEPIIQAGQAALTAGKTRYTAARGIPELREAISGFYQQRYGLNIDPQRILITPGGSGALLLASALLVDPGKHWLLTRVIRATGTSCAWWKVRRNWCRSARTCVIN
jgi:aspartate/methionine/tyrosine aminotransferase